MNTRFFAALRMTRLANDEIGEWRLNKTMNEKVITIFGTSRVKDGDSVFELAYELGKLCAQAGFIIANGGYDGDNARVGRALGVDKQRLY